MKARSIVGMLLFCAVSMFGFAQEQKSQEMDHQTMHQHHGGPRAKFDKAVVQQVWKAWETLDPKNAAKFYVQVPGHAFYDISPLKYADWSEYEKGVTAVFAEMKSLKTTLSDDLKVHDHGDSFVWVTATLKFDIVNKDGKAESIPARWTSIWVNMDGTWKMAHEHVSAPMGGA